ncbi:putative nuclease of restriction endonuclease-like (RecB) superfamily [Hydrogenophaga palleronii]|uniref:Nuclease of restriction endonuclease-like (RecB) superfamily n=1 Tax=Hydrogenophaga palleronii TaxID=65655 RepID=A0ABU1WGK9_9BURK|nr:PDDEXK nuclease domain-containing protein [Hydrogenophaga palleronii]MDR7148222.1 putative nuclease of restriction endonuclease-like (RecB) superfamily [Hydrogenophaga palleronii]
MNELTTFHADIKAILEQARGKARSAVNAAMVEAYWLIGRRIVQEEQQGQHKAQYGTRLMEELSIALTADFGKGFSYANLYNFRQFYRVFPDQQILYTLCRELSWSHLRLIIRADSPQAIEYYCNEAREQNWTVRQLERHIRTKDYQRLLSNQVEASKTTAKAAHLDFIKDPYVLEFLQLPETGQLRESELEQAIIDELQKFLLELGKGFSFVARQMRISTETSHFFIDLVFYNYLLKCFVIIDLKTGKLTHQDIGQMDMYVRMFDDLKRGEDDNPTIGIILCDSKDETVVKYSVIQESQQLFASKYRRILPTEEELIAEIEREKRLIGGRNNECAPSGGPDENTP